jgi:hypothetical protein
MSAGLPALRSSAKYTYNNRRIQARGAERQPWRLSTQRDGRARGLHAPTQRLGYRYADTSAPGCSNFVVSFNVQPLRKESGRPTSVKSTHLPHNQSTSHTHPKTTGTLSAQTLLLVGYVHVTDLASAQQTLESTTPSRAPCSLSPSRNPLRQIGAGMNKLNPNRSNGRLK